MTISTFRNLFSLRNRITTTTTGPTVVGGPAGDPSSAGPASSGEAGSATIPDDRHSDKGRFLPSSCGAVNDSALETDSLESDEGSIAAFWDGIVQVPGVGLCDRRHAARTITMRKSAAGLGGGSATLSLIRDEPVVPLFGQSVHLSVAVDVLRLPWSDGSSDTKLHEAILCRLHELEPPCVD
mmetsp:Transcript_29537/g.88406  ORF Transcript_29537/g.88406 Transcript_29537/m.88406 type:complete len:182 (+) Transcript_29537:2-547(+)